MYFSITKVKELFPTPASGVVFLCYMLFSIAQAISVKASQSHGSYKYNTVTAVLLCEVLKLMLATICYCKDNQLKSLILSVVSNVRILCLYLVPSFLYCAYNNLAFINLSAFDPTTYTILLQLRVVITGVVFQVIFKKYISTKQWISLVLLTFGCMIQQLNMEYIHSLLTDDSSSKKEQNNTNILNLSFNFVLIIVQTVCSCCAGVYNEYLIKGEGATLNVFVHNVFMYIDSIFWNLLVMIFQGTLIEAFTPEALMTIIQPTVIFIIVNNSMIGIITSLFLKTLNSILKTFASAVELLFTAVLSWIILSIPIKFNTWIAIFVVSFSIFLYAQNPVNNQDFKRTRKREDEEKLIINEV